MEWVTSSEQAEIDLGHWGCESVPAVTRDGTGNAVQRMFHSRGPFKGYTVKRRDKFKVRRRGRES